MLYIIQVRFLLLLALLGLSLPVWSAEAPLPTVIGSGASVEGDALSVNGQVVKLWGIDAPEQKQTCKNSANRDYDCFTQAKNVLGRFIGKNQLTCYIRGQDSHGQKIGTCAINGTDLAALMVKAGWALAYYDLSPQYVELEGYAQANKLGLWAGKYVEPPWTWRSRQEKAQ